MRSGPSAWAGALMVLFLAVHLGSLTAHQPIVAAYAGVCIAFLSAILFVTLNPGSLFRSLEQNLLALLLFIGALGVLLPARVMGGVPIGIVRNAGLLFVVGVSCLLLYTQRSGARPLMVEIWPYLAYLLWLTFTATWASDRFFAIRDMANMIYPVGVYMLARLSIRSAEDGERLLRLMKFTLTVLAAVSMVFSLCFLGFFSARGWWRPGASRLLDIPFTIHPLVGTMFVTMELGGYRTVPNWKTRWWLIAVTGLIVYMTLTRAYVMGFLLACCAVLFVRARKNWARLAMVIAGVTLLVALLTVDNPIKRRMFWRPDQITPNTLVENTVTGRLFSPDVIVYSGRLEYWKYLLRRARMVSSPWLGAGVGAARSFMMQSAFAAYPHGDMARVLCDSGYIGLGLFIGIYVTVAVWALCRARQRGFGVVGRTAAVVLLAQAGMTFVAGWVYDMFHAPYQNLTIAMMLAAIIHSDTADARALEQTEDVDQAGPEAGAT